MKMFKNKKDTNLIAIVCVWVALVGACAHVWAWVSHRQM